MENNILRIELIRKDLLYALLILILFSCKKDNVETSNPSTTNVIIIGKAQKGPFKNGSEIVIYELNSDLTQTGISYSTNINNDAGNFSFNDINISTSIALLTATGYFYREPTHNVSLYKLSLEAIADVHSGSAINVNLLTHLIKPRIEKLVADGNSFTSARVQAQNELKSFLHVPYPDSTNFEKLDVTNSNFLFATSLIFQRRKYYDDGNFDFIYELNDLINRFRSDFRDNGQIDSQEIIDTLLFNANRVQLIDDRINLDNYMTSQGFTTSLSGFDKYIYAFQRAYSTQVYVNTVFPDSAIYDIDNNFMQLKSNILYDTASTFHGGGQFILSAIVPFDSSLTIKFTMLSQDSGSYSFFAYNYGWYRTNFSNGFNLEAQQKNNPNACVMWLVSTANGDSARIDYYLNNQPAPYFSKIINW